MQDTNVTTNTCGFRLEKSIYFTYVCSCVMANQLSIIVRTIQTLMTRLCLQAVLVFTSQQSEKAKRDGSLRHDNHQLYIELYAIHFTLHEHYQPLCVVYSKLYLEMQEVAIPHSFIPLVHQILIADCMIQPIYFLERQKFNIAFCRLTTRSKQHFKESNVHKISRNRVWHVYKLCKHPHANLEQSHANQNS